MSPVVFPRLLWSRRLHSHLIGVAILALATCCISAGASAQTAFVIDFDVGTDSLGNSQGQLVFTAPSGFSVSFDDDQSSGGFGGNANGVHITNLGAGNSKSGSPTDFVLGAFNDPIGAENYHSSGIVATFSEGADSVSFLDTDDDGTTKRMFAFDQNGALLAQTAPASQTTFAITTAMTGGVKIWSVEFDTQAGSAGGASDGTYFTLDSFEVIFGGLNTIDIDFNSGVDSLGKSQGSLQFNGPDGFIVYLTDDDSNGPQGGNADGVHINNINFGNIKVGSPTDFVLGAYNTFSGVNNLHSSGIVATFNQGATLVSFDDTDDDSTVKALFAFDQNNILIGQSNFASQIPVIVDTSQTGGKLIYKVEFDTAAGTAGGSLDGTYFTIDNFHAEGVDPTTEVPIDPPDDICDGVVCSTPPGACFAAPGTCNPTTGQCEYGFAADTTPCSDSNPCTLGTTCDGAGVCGTPTDSACNDGIACTIDTCDAELGCTHTPDGPGCDGNSCSTGGDLNGSGAVTVGDVVCLILATLAELSSSPPPGCIQGPAELANLDCNGVVDVVDVTLCIQLAIAGQLGPAADRNANSCVDACELTACPDAECGGTEDCLLCAADCGSCTGSCCDAHSTAGCDNDTIQECVCALDASCCYAGSGWHAGCATLAASSCGASCP